MLIVVCVIVFLYWLVYTLLPVFVTTNNNTTVKFLKDKSKQGMYKIYPAERIAIPSYQWREIITNLVIAPFGSFTIGKFSIFLLGRGGYRIVPIYDVCMHGMLVMSTDMNDLPRQPVRFVVYNANPTIPQIARVNEPIAYLEFYRIPSFISINW